ncbi:hypothetical protein ACFSY7_05845 [Kurthia populi]|uniref:Uncharacterized protein n=1 Tax=Kurthia populi TaxID=1562132 RepID=A0ABW5XYA6_9BACL
MEEVSVLNEKEVSIINDVITLYERFREKHTEAKTNDILANAQAKHKAKSELVDYLNNLDDSDVKTVMALSYIGNNEFASDKSPEHMLTEWRHKVSSTFDDKEHRVNHVSEKPLDVYLANALKILNK